MSPTETILLVRTDEALGALKTLAALRALRAARPSNPIALVASDANHSLFAHEPGISLHVLPKNWKRMKRENWLAALGLSGPYDRLLNLVADPNDAARAVTETVAARQKYGPETIPGFSPQGRDETENVALLMARATGAKLPAVAGFASAPRISEADETEAAEKMGLKQGSWLGLCPVTRSRQRMPPLKRWEKFVQRVTREQSDSRYFLFGTPADYRALERLRAQAADPERVELVFPTSYRALGAYLRRLDGVVAVDSTPLHLARSLGVRTLGIVGRTDVQRWMAAEREGELLLRRGLFNRFPTALEMAWAFDRWKQLPNPQQIPTISSWR